MALPWDTLLGAVTAIGTLLAAGVAAWAVADARVSRSRDERARLVNALYWPLKREVDAAQASPWPSFTIIVSEWHSIQLRHPELTLLADRRIVATIERIESALSPGLHRKAETEANRIILEKVLAADPTFSSSRSVQFQMILGGSPSDIIPLRDVWAHDRKLTDLARALADSRGYSEWDVRIHGDGVAIHAGLPSVEAIYEEGKKSFRESEIGQKYSEYIRVCSGSTIELHHILGQKLKI